MIVDVFPLESLMDDLLLVILSYLPALELFKVICVNRRFKRLGDHPVLWRNIVKGMKWGTQVYEESSWKPLCVSKMQRTFSKMKDEDRSTPFPFLFSKMNKPKLFYQSMLRPVTRVMIYGDPQIGKTSLKFILLNEQLNHSRHGSLRTKIKVAIDNSTSLIVTVLVILLI